MTAPNKTDMETEALLTKYISEIATLTKERNLFQDQCIRLKRKLSALTKERDEFAAVCEKQMDDLSEAREALQFANDTPNGPICDTIWMMHRPETLFDFMDEALSTTNAAEILRKRDAAVLREAADILSRGADWENWERIFGKKDRLVLPDPGHNKETDIAAFLSASPSSAKVIATSRLHEADEKETASLTEQFTAHLQKSLDESLCGTGEAYNITLDGSNNE